MILGISARVPGQPPAFLKYYFRGPFFIAGVGVPKTDLQGLHPSVSHLLLQVLAVLSETEQCQVPTQRCSTLMWRACVARGVSAVVTRSSRGWRLHLPERCIRIQLPECFWPSFADPLRAFAPSLSPCPLVSFLGDCTEKRVGAVLPYLGLAALGERPGCAGHRGRVRVTRMTVVQLLARARKHIPRPSSEFSHKPVPTREKHESMARQVQISSPDYWKVVPSHASLSPLCCCCSGTSLVSRLLSSLFFLLALRNLRSMACFSCEHRSSSWQKEGAERFESA